MVVEVAVRPPGDATLALAVADPPAPATDLPAGLADAVASGEAPSERGLARLLHLPGGRIVAAGVGRRDEIDADALRDAAAAATIELRSTVGGDLAWRLDDSLPLRPEDQVRAAVEGVMLGGYDPGAWKSAERPALPGRLTLVTDHAVGPAAARAEIVSRWTNEARDIGNGPANEVTPARLAEIAAGIAGRFDSLSFEALGPEGMRARGMGALLAVASGSHTEPRLIVLRHEPAAAASSADVLGLVGKGLTFDTGGISLKPAAYMEDLKGDKTGGVAVIAAMGAIAELELPVRAIGVVGAVENVTGGGSYRPGDILRAANGKTIEVANTDAEGRIVLADALHHAREQGVTHLLDLATLTGAMDRALGDLYAGVFGDDTAWRDEVVAAGETSGDHAWPWPMHRRYRKLIDSVYADMKNYSIRMQAIPPYAAEFLREFAGEGPWAHVDMAGTGFLTWPRGDYISQKGATGYGVRMIVELATRFSAR
jgi:leucyl aminopeptidase